MATNRYESPLSTRYSSLQMQELFSDDTKFWTWRKLWIELARAQKDLGLPISSEQIMEMEAHIHDIDYAWIAQEERRTRHDVVAHIHGFARMCPSAAPIVHLGATSMYVSDNTDLILLKRGIEMLTRKLARVIERMSRFASEYKSMPALGYTHLQTAQLVTVGKRACMWMQDLLIDLDNLEQTPKKLRFLGAKGATGTQASFLALFDGDHGKVEALDVMVARAFGFADSFIITGQTYSRKLDSEILGTLAGLGTSIHKILADFRFLQHLQEIEEPFESAQVGSTAMPYKRNPMRCERGCSLARHLIALSMEAHMTHQTQGLERTLDDSAGRRITLPEAFLTADAILNIAQNIFEGVIVYPNVIRRNINQELPFMATEEILAAMVKAGADRQKCHEQLRVLAQQVGVKIKQDGADNDFMLRLRQSKYFSPIHTMLETILDPMRFIGRAREQVEIFMVEEVSPVLEAYRPYLSGTSELHV